MKKTFKLIAALLSCLLLFSFVACGGEKDNGTGVTLDIGILADSGEREIMDAFIAAFNEKQERENVPEGQRIKIRIKVFNDYATNILKWNASGTMPDMFFVLDTYSAYFSQAGLLEPLNKYVERDNIDMTQYYESIIKMASPLEDGELYFVPRDYNKAVMVINKDMFEAAGITLPDKEGNTWSEIETIAAQLKTAMDNNVSSAAGLSAGNFPLGSMGASTNICFQSWVSSYGGTLIKDGKGNFDDEKVIAAFNKMREFQDKGYAGQSTSYSKFNVKESAITFTVRPSIKSFQSLGINVEFYPFPSYDYEGTDSKVVFGCTGYGICSKTDQKSKDASWEFLKFIFSEEGQEAFSKTGLCVPVIKSMAQDKNATWRKAIYPGANHDAFVLHPERDTQATYLIGSGAPNNVHKNLYAQIETLCGGFLSSNYQGQGSLASFVNYANSQVNYIIEQG